MESHKGIFRETGIARETIRKYTRLYEQKLKELSVLKDEDNIIILVGENEKKIMKQSASKNKALLMVEK